MYRKSWSKLFDVVFTSVNPSPPFPRSPIHAPNTTPAGPPLRQLGKRRMSTPSVMSLQQQCQSCRTLSTLPSWLTQRWQQQQRQQQQQQRLISHQSIESSRGYNNAGPWQTRDNNDNHSSTAYTASGAAARRVLYDGHSPTTPWQRAALAGWAAFSALRNPERADMVATLGEVTGGIALERMYRYAKCLCTWISRTRSTVGDDSPTSPNMVIQVYKHGHGHGQP